MFGSEGFVPAGGEGKARALGTRSWKSVRERKGVPGR